MLGAKKLHVSFNVNSQSAAGGVPPSPRARCVLRLQARRQTKHVHLDQGHPLT